VGVNVSGVDQVKTGVNETIEQAERGGLVRRPAEDVSTKDEGRDFQTAIAEFAFFHGLRLDLKVNCSTQANRRLE
jgi:hypothetical protein